MKLALFLLLVPLTLCDLEVQIQPEPLTHESQKTEVVSPVADLQSTEANPTVSARSLNLHRHLIQRPSSSRGGPAQKRVLLRGRTQRLSARKADEEYAGDEYTGDEDTGDEYAGDEYAGDENAGDEYAGDEDAGHEGISHDTHEDDSHPSNCETISEEAFAIALDETFQQDQASIYGDDAELNDAYYIANQDLSNQVENIDDFNSVLQSYYDNETYSLTVKEIKKILIYLNLLGSFKDNACDGDNLKSDYADDQGARDDHSYAEDKETDFYEDERKRKRVRIARKAPQVNIKQLGSTRRAITRNPAIFRRLVGKSGHRGLRRHHHRHHRHHRQAKGRGHHVHRHLQGSNASRNVHRFYHRPAQVVNPQFAGRVINQPVRRTFKRVFRPASQFKGGVIRKVNGLV